MKLEEHCYTKYLGRVEETSESAQLEESIRLRTKVNWNQRISNIKNGREKSSN